MIHDNDDGPCACGAWHTPSDFPTMTNANAIFSPGDRVRFKCLPFSAAAGTVVKIESRLDALRGRWIETVTVEWNNTRARYDYDPSQLELISARPGVVVWTFPTDVNNLKAELMETARRLGALRQELARRQREARKAEVEAFRAELEKALAGGECVPPAKVDRRKAQRRNGIEGDIQRGYYRRKTYSDRRKADPMTAPVKPRDL